MILLHNTYLGDVCGQCDIVYGWGSLRVVVRVCNRVQEDVLVRGGCRDFLGEHAQLPQFLVERLQRRKQKRQRQKPKNVPSTCTTQGVLDDTRMSLMGAYV